MKMLTYVVTRGREKGVVLTPHRGVDEKYVASPTRFKKDYVKVERVEDLIPLMQKGYGVMVLLLALSTLVVLPAIAHANHRWGGFHWARTVNPFTVLLGDKVSDTWYDYLLTARDDLGVSGVLDTVIVTSGADPSTCGPTSGRVEVQLCLRQ